MNRRFAILGSLVLGAVLIFTGCRVMDEEPEIEDVFFKMVYVPVSGGITFPTKTDDSGNATVTAAYEIGETAVTYEMWYAVKTWAESNGYTFYGNPGREGSSGSTQNTTPGANRQEPVTMVSWFDSVVWLNALTSWYNEKNPGSNLTPVYYYDSSYAAVAKDSTPTLNFVKETPSYTYASAYAKPGATGFRLPTSNEWELAARWQGTANKGNSVTKTTGSTTYYFTKGDSASGATADYLNATENARVAVYGVSKTAAVKSKAANALGLYDMSGNVFEWCEDWENSGSFRIGRGGSWINSGLSLRVGTLDGIYPAGLDDVTGFRLARTSN